ncbi:nascent polypeptide-associated complex subunit beta [Mrakia frigida]|uniref:nascent polypeptide-associated complex subunit family protein n=1 Tax=Mrakia frigida TaxID=29902 RepID=UPI003FCC05EB
MDQAKLLKLQQSVRIGGKGTPRRKVIKKSVASTQADDKKLQAALKKLNVAPIAGVEEVNMFRDDGNVLHFSAPKVHAALPSNTMAIYGTGQVKELTELVPGILNQLGPDSLASLRKLAESYQQISSNQQRVGGGAEKAALEGENDEDDDDVPDLVESFEVDEKKEGENKLDELSELGSVSFGFGCLG